MTKVEQTRILSAILLWVLFIGWGTAQSATVSLSQKGEPVILSCDVQADTIVSYQWYRSKKNSNKFGEAIDGADSVSFVTDSFSNREVRFYYCVAKLSGAVTKRSDVIIAAYTGLPVVNINTVNGIEPTAEYVEGENYGYAITNAKKVAASMQIIDSEGKVVYESGGYSKKKSGLTIKLRGNTSVDLLGKSSYKIKLQKKADLLASLISRSGDAYQDQDWILLKMVKGFDAFVGFAVCDIVGVPWTPKYAFVNVVINNDYRGLYMLIECVNRNESRVNVSETGYIIERDAYWWNEKVRFITPNYNQKFTFKYPDEDDITQSQLSYIEQYVNTLEQNMRNGLYEDFVDVESFSRWLFVHDLLGSMDGAGSNIFMAKYDNTENTKLYMLTNWDFDSNYMQEGKWSNQHDDEWMYAASMFKSADRTFAETYMNLYDRYVPVLWDSLKEKWNGLESSLGEQIDLSCYCDSVRWNLEWQCSLKENYDTVKNWFVSRKEWLKNVIEKTHVISYELNGGIFKTDYPDSVSFLDNIEIPQPKKAGYTFAGWTGPFNVEPEANFVLYGYMVISDIQLNANWIMNDLSAESYQLEVFSIKGEFLGYVNVNGVNLQSMSKVLKRAGYASGVYIIRGDRFNRVLRVRDY